MHSERGLGYPHHIRRRVERNCAGHTVSFVHGREFGGLRFGVVHQLASLDGELAHDQFVLRRDADPLAGGHARCPSNCSGEARQTHHGGVDAGSGETDDQRDIGDQPVADPEDRSPSETAGDRAVTGMRFRPTTEREATHFLDATD